MTKLRKTRTPGVKMPTISEAVIHKQIARLLTISAPKHLLWWHTPNGEKRDTITAAKLKAMGVKPGVPDFLLYDLQTGYLHCLEVKSRDGHLSDAQKGWMTTFQLSPTGRYAVVRSLDEAMLVMMEWWPTTVRFGRAGLILPGGAFVPADSTKGAPMPLAADEERVASETPRSGPAETTECP